jgi:hypothetical protein
MPGASGALTFERRRWPRMPRQEGQKHCVIDSGRCQLVRDPGYLAGLSCGRLAVLWRTAKSWLVGYLEVDNTMPEPSSGP